MTPDLVAVLDGLDQGIVVIDEKGAVSFCNRVAEAMLGWSSPDMLGRDLHQLIHSRRPSGDPYDRASCPILATLGDGVARRGQYDAMICRDGRFVRVFLSVKTLRQDGIVCGAVVSFHETRPRDVIEQKLLEREKFLKAITDALPGMVGYWTADLRCSFANHAYQIWFGRTPEEMIGLPMRELLGEDLFWANEPYVRGVLRGEPQCFERVLVKADGSIGNTWAHYIPDVENGVVKGFLVLVTDVTELKMAQKQLEDMNETLMVRTREAEAANRAKGAFLSVMSHELRTPLHTILGYTSILRNAADARAKEMLSIIEASGRQLLRLIEDILDFSQSGTPRVVLLPAYFSLAALVGRLNSSARILASRRHNDYEFDLVVPPSTLIEADEQRLTQILQNLIDNACKFTLHGVVRLEIASEAVNDGDQSPDRTCRRYRFAVNDNGSGIPLDQQAAIFEPFFRGQGKENVPGAGLGLAIAKQLVEAMGGTLEVSSTPGKGSCFQFALICPTRYEHEVADLARNEGRIVRYEGRQRTLVVADDVPANLVLLERLCDSWGFRVIPAVNGEEAIRACLEARPAPDAVLIDQFMPVHDGWDFLRAIRSAHGIPDLPVILISAAAMAPPADFPVGIQFDAYLKKPVMLDDLSSALGNLLHLDWVRETEAGQSWPDDVPAAPALTADEWQAFDSMVQMGRLPAIRQWATKLPTERPELGEFCKRVNELCKEVNLEGLQQILDRHGQA